VVACLAFVQADRLQDHQRWNNDCYQEYVSFINGKQIPFKLVSFLGEIRAILPDAVNS
jgi:hypothetical protein